MRKLPETASLACGAYVAAIAFSATALAGGYGYYPAPSYYEPAYSARYEYHYGPYYDGYYGYRTTYLGFPFLYSTYGSGYDTPCSRLVRVYDDAGGWVWGRQYYC